MHGSVLGFFAAGALRKIDVQGRDVLEVGSLDVNGSVRPIVTAYEPRSYLGVDVMDGPGVDRVLDATDLAAEFGENSADVVISTEMLEHAADWKACVRNMVTVLRPGGLWVFTTRSVGFPYHHPPDHWRYTLEAAAAIVEACGLQLRVCTSDPEQPGVFVKARKPEGWQPPDWAGLDAVEGVTPVSPPVSVLGLPFAPDGSGYHRFYLPYKHLSADTARFVVGITPPGARFTPTDEQVAMCDVVAGQRWCGAEGLATLQRWKGKTKLVYETDDDLTHPDPSGLPHLFDEAVQESVVRCLALSDLVTVSTEPLAGRMRRYNDNVKVLPNFVNAELLDLKRPKRDRLTVGWSGGTSHLQDVMVAAGPLREVLDAEPGIDVHFAGADFSPVVDRPGRCRWTGWKIDVWEFYTGIDFDISVAPLAHTPFNDCKSHLRALEAAALGIPVVASAEPPYNDFVRDGETGFLCRSHAEWTDRLRLLIADAGLREEMGAKAKALAADWTIQRNWTLWADAYLEVCGGSKAGA